MENIGKVVATTKTPATVNEFAFWVASGAEPDVEVGNIVVAQRKGNRQKVFGLITEIKFYTDADSAFADYYSHEFGKPLSQPPTQRQEIHVATAEVIGSKPRAIRPTKGGLVRLADAEEVQTAYGMDQIEDPVMCGVIPNGNDPARMAPALISQRFLIGPEGAHANFSGASGLATKTSAAISLLSGLLSSARKGEASVAVIAFNVKSEDLLFLERNGDGALLDAIYTNADQTERRVLDLYEDHGVDLSFDNVDLSYFAPGRPFNPEKPNSLRGGEDGVQSFFYTLGEVRDADVPIRLHGVFDPGDLDDRSLGVLASVEDWLDEKGREISTFREMMQEFPADQSSWRGHHGATVAKVRRALQTNLKEILSGLFSWDKERGRQIPVEDIASGDLWVIDIQSINDKGKRLVFANILERVARLLEREKSRSDGKKPRLDAVVIFVDELNKFAPSSGKGTARLRDRIVDIAARGRSIGLVLLGAEQFASSVHKEVIGNVSTQFVGRTEQLELSSKPYRWISRDLQYLVSTLPKGRLLLRHALFNRPVFIKFPRPLFTYEPEEVEKAIAKANKKEEKEEEGSPPETDFDRLRDALKGREGIHPLEVWDDVPKLRELGVSHDTFKSWYQNWLGGGSYVTGSANERQALKLVLDRYGDVR